MATSLGSLVVSLGLDAVQFTSGLTKAEYNAKKLGETIGNGIKAGSALAVAGIATIATAATTAYVAIDHLVKQAGDFQDLAEKTGASAEALASFGVAAAVGGTNVESIAQASIKLTKNLTGVDDESKAAGAAIAALNLDLGKFKALSPEDQIEEVSKALAGFADGAGKTAVATALFGKSGADLIPFLKSLQELGGRQVILTAEQIKQADDYADKQAKTRAELQQYAQSLATQLLPAQTAFTGAISDTIKELLGLDKASKDFKAGAAISETAENGALALASLADSAFAVVQSVNAIVQSYGAAAAIVGALVDRNLTGAIEIARAAREYGDNMKFNLGLADKLAARFANARREAANFDDEARRRQGRSTGREELPKLNFNGGVKSTGAGSADDPVKKLLDNQLKLLENAAKEEEDILRSRNKFLDLVNGENLIGTKEFFETKRAILSAAVSSQIALYDQEIAALEKYKNAPGRKATDQETAQGKINDLRQKSVKLIREQGETAAEYFFKEEKAAEDLERQLNGVNAEILELIGNVGAAARLRFGDQFKSLRDRLTANGDNAGLTQLKRLEDLKVAQADYTQHQDEAGRVVESLRIQEERLGISQQVGALGELEYLRRIGEARQGSIALLEAEVRAREAIARASGNPKLAQDAERARLELEKLQAVANPLADKFNNLFADAAGSAFADFVTGTKSASDAFKSFTNTIFRELTNLIAKDLFKQLFSSSGGGDFGGFNIGGILANIFGGGKASGGPVQAGKFYQVNEQGPELLDVNGKQFLMTGARNGRITPNSSLGGGQPINYITVTVPAGTSRETGTQIAAGIQRKLAAGMRNR